MSSKYYKVLRKSPADGSLYSVAAGPYKLKYRQGEWTHGTCGPILLFETLRTALFFTDKAGRGGSRLEIWLCEALLPVVAVVSIIPSTRLWAFSQDDLRTWWAQEHHKMTPDAVNEPWTYAPSGTVGSWGIRLLEPVDNTKEEGRS